MFRRYHRRYLRYFRRCHRNLRRWSYLRGWRGLITLDYVLRKGTQCNWRERQARVCVLCDAFYSHTALPRAQGVHQPRDSAVFPLKTNNHNSNEQGDCLGKRAGEGRHAAAGGKGNLTTPSDIARPVLTPRSPPSPFTIKKMMTTVTQERRGLV